MVTLHLPPDIHQALDDHLAIRAEQVGFCLAQWDPQTRTFEIREWRAVSGEGLSSQSEVHLALADQTRAEIIRWAWTSGLSLIEAHSHGALGYAAFSGSDLWGFDEWVPHLWWRLRARPYAAIVTADDEIDALAWIEGPRVAEQVDRLRVGDANRPTSRRTLDRRLSPTSLRPRHG